MLAIIPKKIMSIRYQRSKDPYWDRRSGEDNRKSYWTDYFASNGTERRHFKERRSGLERRKGYVRVSAWTSVRCYN